MGISGISIWQLLIVLAIVVMLFGTKRLRSLGSDLGSMIKGFKSSMSSEEAAKKDEEEAQKNLEQKTVANSTSAEKTEQNNTKV
ncbi:twin-arginine translocase subunit, sec-independent protein export [Cellvibrio sp. BR]|jgi:sec-independent protein translocase protein TatA|uniref:twin-arginine translocase TatA/TatE family subunit n=1 Tax=unclassified Cellvibrio TaxID=2624793 RepID=UPI0002601061|nr:MULTISPECIES: twin-arginine translocase TatA/TatE family subunit [unclassified Cellvibrio]EIK43611.1 twin-arginine translocase subunit, sec-independent protein export [Cellvibrio sp. BR]QEY10902.1 twin-arginine translocase TatA/TatE family subunit [Cellvibrio sp. KY-YJ-3]UUA70949.1 twin-arginine translocase TatA/TatE family subunit [Cellvibrio sp. QJXJ]